VYNGAVKFQYVPTNEMLADMLTKPISREQHERHRSLINVTG